MFPQYRLTWTQLPLDYITVQLIQILGIFMMQPKVPETRGRPRKQQTRTLSPIYKEKFSDNSAIIHACSLIYVFQIFIASKKEKRVGHKDGGFTIYDKTDSSYCFDNWEQVMEKWGYAHLLQIKQMYDLIKLLPAIGPEKILHEIIELIDIIIKLTKNGKEEIQIIDYLSNQSDMLNPDQHFSHLRFTPPALKRLKLEKTQISEELIHERVNKLWRPLLVIFVHTILNCYAGRVTNKYFKPFFSDAENPYSTYIGQLNLQQIVDSIAVQGEYNRKLQEVQKMEGFRKFRQVQVSENKVQLVAIPQNNQESAQKPIPPQIIRPIISVSIPKKAKTPSKDTNMQRPSLVVISSKQAPEAAEIKDDIIKQQLDAGEKEEAIVKEQMKGKKDKTKQDLHEQRQNNMIKQQQEGQDDDGNHDQLLP